MMISPLVLIVGASDLGTACAIRLFRSGMKLVILEKNNPSDLYHTRCFSSAVSSGKKMIEQVNAITFSYFLTEVADDTEINLDGFIRYQIENRQIPVILESEINVLSRLKVDYVISCSKNLYDAHRDLLHSTGKLIGFSDKARNPEFDYTVCISGENISRVFYPFLIDEYATETEQNNIAERFEVVKAPIEGIFNAHREINEIVNEKDVLGDIAGIPILSPVHGRVTGILNSGLIVPAHVPFVEIDRKRPYRDGKRLTPESFNLAGGVLEAVLFDSNLQ